MPIRTCPLCEATCGLELTLDGDQVVSVRGDRDDVFSHGFICPKGAALRQLHHDPDRLQIPLVRGSDGRLAPASWDQAFALIDERMRPILDSDRNAVGVYLGNPNAHNLDNLLYLKVLLKALRTRNAYSASTVDQYPKQMASALMFGTGTTVAVPDLDRTDYLLMLGANPLASNGSLMTAPDVRGRLRALRARGGRLVVLDPRRTRTAEMADEHHFIRPGTDAHFLMALVHVLFADGLADPGPRLMALCEGIETVRGLATPFTAERAAIACGIAAADIRRLAHELASARRAAVYGRIGTCTQEFGALASWLVDVVNVLTGNLDRDGGAMFPLAAAGHANASGPPGRGRGAVFGRWHSRVRGLPEVFGELPAAAMAEEIDTPGDGQVRALITIAGNPVLSTPNSARLERALSQLELMVSVDAYENETTGHADVILPVPSALARSHYDLALYLFAIRNVANFSPPLLAAPPDVPAEWVTLLRLTGVVSGMGADADVAGLDDFVARQMVQRELATPGSPVAARTADELLAALAPRVGPERLLDFLLRVGPYGDAFGARAGCNGDSSTGDGGLSLATLEASPHGVDLGPLEPRLPDALRTAGGRIELAPEPLVADVPRLIASLEGGDGDGLVLIGRRHLRSNNSWMHNLPVLVKGPPACTLQVHPRDAQRLGLVDGGAAQVRSRVGALIAQVSVTDALMPGVVSLPHGWGHDAARTGQRVAGAHAGVNSNELTDEQVVDRVSGNAVLNGIPVEVRAAAPGASLTGSAAGQDVRAAQMTAKTA